MPSLNFVRRVTGLIAAILYGVLCYWQGANDPHLRHAFGSAELWGGLFLIIVVAALLLWLVPDATPYKTLIAILCTIGGTLLFEHVFRARSLYMLAFFAGVFILYAWIIPDDPRNPRHWIGRN